MRSFLLSCCIGPGWGAGHQTHQLRLIGWRVLLSYLWAGSVSLQHDQLTSQIQQDTLSWAGLTHTDGSWVRIQMCECVCVFKWVCVYLLRGFECDPGLGPYWREGHRHHQTRVRNIARHGDLLQQLHTGRRVRTDDRETTTFKKC